MSHGSFKESVLAPAGRPPGSVPIRTGREWWRVNEAKTLR